MKILESNSIEYVWLDPLVFEDDVPQTLKDCRIKEILPEEKYDVIAVLAAHTSFGILNYATLAPSLKPSGTIVDGRRFFTPDEIKEFTENGIQYVGVGRA